jgi:hypothetical protein
MCLNKIKMYSTSQNMNDIFNLFNTSLKIFYIYTNIINLLYYYTHLQKYYLIFINVIVYKIYSC